MRQTSLSIEIGLLGFFRQEPKHGYAIHQELSDPAGLGQVWQIKLSQLYALLSKLEEAGFLSATVEPQEGKPPRKLLHLTDEGKEAYHSWIEEPVSHGRSLRLEFLVKLYFARVEGDDVAANLLDVQRQQCREWLAAEQEMVDEEIAKKRRYGRLVHQFRLGQIQAMVDWLKYCEEL